MSDVVQYGIPRSGSTMIFNMIRLMYPDREVEKTHNFTQEHVGCKYVGTFRDFKDVLVSHKRMAMAQRGVALKGYLPRKTIDSYIQHYTENHFKYANQYKEYGEGIWLDYKHFAQNPQFAYEQIVQFLGDSDEDKNEILHFCSKANMQHLSSQIESGDPDGTTKLYGGHFSPEGSNWRMHVQIEDLGYYEQRLNIMNAEFKRIVFGGR